MAAAGGVGRQRERGHGAEANADSTAKYVSTLGLLRTYILFTAVAVEWMPHLLSLYFLTSFTSPPFFQRRALASQGRRHREGGEHNFEITSITHSQVTLLRLFPSPGSYTPARTPNPRTLYIPTGDRSLFPSHRPTQNRYILP